MRINATCFAFLASLFLLCAEGGGGAVSGNAHLIENEAKTKSYAIQTELAAFNTSTAPFNGNGGGGGGGSLPAIGACLTTAGSVLNTTNAVPRATVTGTTDDVLAADACTIVSYNNASGVAVTAPSASAAGFTQGFYATLKNKGAGNVTVTPSSGTINGTASFVIVQNTGCGIYSDGTNWQLDYASCNALSGGSGVLSVSGDSTIFSNSSSTGAVTLTKANAAATTLLGNPTGSSAAPSYTTAPVVSGAMGAASFNASTAATGYGLAGHKAFFEPANDTGGTGASIGIGNGALTGQTAGAAGYFNTAIGFNSLNGNLTTAGGSNTAIGAYSLFADTTGHQNTAIGLQALFLNTTGNSNAAIGNMALGNNTSGSGNTAFGNSTLQSNNGSDNVALGNVSLVTATAAFNNTAVGSLTLLSATNNDNTTVGYKGLFATTTGSGNTAVGKLAGQANTTGSGNTILGNSVGSTTLSTGNNNILIGTGSGVDTVAASSSNEANIGGLLFYNTNSTAAPAVSACGTSPTIDSRANNRSGTVTAGTGVAASCTITFAGSGYSTWNHCRVTSQAIVTSLVYSYTLTAITIAGTTLVSDKFDYDCDGY